MAKLRNEVMKENQWNVEALYPSFENWKKEFEQYERKDQNLRWSEMIAFRGTLRHPQKLFAFLEISLKTERHLTKLYTYAHLRHDEDLTNDQYKQAYVRISSLLFDFRQEISWFEPEILSFSQLELDQMLVSEELNKYQVYLKKMIQLKEHTLCAEEEKLLALAAKAFETSHKAFSAFNHADLKFPSIKNGKGEELELTHAKYLLYMKQPDRVLRENSFKTLHQSYHAYENTLCELINGEIQKHVFEMKARRYSSSLQAALYPYQIDTQVYFSLIEAVRSRLPSLHRYIETRKKILNLKELHLYDLHLPLIEDVNISIEYEEAEKLIIDSVAILGKDYQEDLKKGLMVDRWVDRFENVGKRSGAYSSGCYDSMPYILMNYEKTVSDVLTLSHEAGHSMHTLLSSRTQPYHYSQYPIFLAEVASTFHEELLVRHLLAKVKTQKERSYLINQQIETIRSTLFRQTMFAEFELALHRWVEEGIPLTPTFLKMEYRKLNQAYFGQSLVIDEEIDIEWARIPHFYYNFYVYQYATGISAAHALVQKVDVEKEKARNRYLEFLSSGCNQYPLELLKIAGIDMTTKTPIESLIDYFDQLVEQLEKSLSSNSL